MKLDFSQMPTPELRAYVLKNRDDLEALDILVSRRTPDSEATWYGPMATEDGVPIEENIRLAEEAIKQRIKQAKRKKSPIEIRRKSCKKITYVGQKKITYRGKETSKFSIFSPF